MEKHLINWPKCHALPKASTGGVQQAQLDSSPNWSACIHQQRALQHNVQYTRALSPQLWSRSPSAQRATGEPVNICPQPHISRTTVLTYNHTIIAAFIRMVYSIRCAHCCMEYICIQSAYKDGLSLMGPRRNCNAPWP